MFRSTRPRALSAAAAQGVRTCSRPPTPGRPPARIHEGHPGRRRRASDRGVIKRKSSDRGHFAPVSRLARCLPPPPSRALRPEHKAVGHAPAHPHPGGHPNAFMWGTRGDVRAILRRWNMFHLQTGVFHLCSGRWTGFPPELLTSSPVALHCGLLITCLIRLFDNLCRPSEDQRGGCNWLPSQ